MASTILPDHRAQPLPEMPSPVVLGDKVRNTMTKRQALSCLGRQGEKNNDKDKYCLVFGEKVRKTGRFLMRKYLVFGTLP